MNIDYTTLALEHMILTESLYNACIIDRYNAESEFILECMESGCIVEYVAEASADGRTAFQKLKELVKTFFDKIIGVFRKKSIDYNKRYTQWVKDNRDEFVTKAKEMKDSLTAVPFWKVTNPLNDARDISNAIQKAGSSKDFTDTSWLSNFVDNAKTTEDVAKIRADLPGYLKNYFRIHEKNKDVIEKVSISGKDISSVVNNMVDYILKYDSVVKELENIQKTLDNTITRLEKTEPVADSMIQYFDIEGIALEHSDLSLLEGFVELLEADGANNEEKKAGSVENKDGEKESATSVATSTELAKKEAVDKGESPKEAKEKTDSYAYARTIQNLFQLVVTAYMTACEERYLTYLNLLFKIMGERPSVDKNGNYKKKEEDTTKVTAESTIYNKPTALKGLSLYK